MKLVIDISENTYNLIARGEENRDFVYKSDLMRAILEGTPLPKGYGRLGDLDELEQRISNFVEHDAKITDEYTVVRQRFIVDDIRQTPTIIEADKVEREQ